MNNYIKEIKAIMVFLIVGLIIFGFTFILVHFEIEYYFYFCVILYLLISALFTMISSLIKSQILNKITHIVLLPANIIFNVGTLFIPFGFIFIHILYYISLSFMIPFGFLKLLDVTNIIIIENEETKLYVKFTATVFIAVLFNYQLRKLIYKISPARIKSSKKLKPYQLDKLTDYLLSENNIRFLIYSLYVFLLLIINFKNFENVSFSKSNINDKAILQSFVAFIAFDRALALLKQVEFKPSDFLNKIIKSILNKYNDLDQKKDNNT